MRERQRQRQKTDRVYHPADINSQKDNQTIRDTYDLISLLSVRSTASMTQRTTPVAFLPSSPMPILASQVQWPSRTQSDCKVYVSMMRDDGVGMVTWVCLVSADSNVLPLDRLVLETDSPYMTPRPLKGICMRIETLFSSLFALPTPIHPRLPPGSFSSHRPQDLRAEESSSR